MALKGLSLLGLKDKDGIFMQFLIKKQKIILNQ